MLPNKPQSFLMYTAGLLMAVLTIIISVGGIFILQGTNGMTRNSSKVVTVQGTGEVSIKPDIAEFSFTVSEKAKTVAEAQTTVTKSIDTVLAALAAVPIEEKDIITNSYSANPYYEWVTVPCREGYCPGGESKLMGYEVAQSISLTLRDFDQIGEVISILGENNVENLWGPNLRLEDPDDAEREARDLAIERARADAQKLAESLGVTLGRMVNFSEGYDGGYPVPYARGMSGADSASYDMAMVSEKSASPTLPTGEQKVTSTVSMTFRIK